MADNLSIEQIDQHTNIMPSILNLYLRQITNNEAFGFRLLKLTVQDIRRSSFITSDFMKRILCDGVRGYELLLLHDSTDSAPGDNHSAFLKLDFDFSSAVGFSILVEDVHNRFGDVIFFGWFFRFVIKRTSCDWQDVAHC